jgi:Nucleoside-diphosphate-sugar epimerases
MRGMPGCPRLYFGVVDVRDVADLHLRAMTNPAAKGERFIAVSGEVMSMLDIARVLKTRLGDAAKKVPRGSCRTGSYVSRRCSIPRYGPCCPYWTTHGTRRVRRLNAVLGWRPRSREDAIAATAESLIKFEIVANGRP